MLFSDPHRTFPVDCRRFSPVPYRPSSHPLPAGYTGSLLEPALLLRSFGCKNEYMGLETMLRRSAKCIVTFRLTKIGCHRPCSPCCVRRSCAEHKPHHAVQNIKKGRRGHFCSGGGEGRPTPKNKEMAERRLLLIRTHTPSMGRCDALGAGLTAFALVGGVVSFSPSSLPISSVSGELS